jgi:predicted acylesterase/phospholipase RssA
MTMMIEQPRARRMAMILSGGGAPGAYVVGVQ